MDNIILFVKSFSVTPGSRYKEEGKRAHSGEEFRESILEPQFELAEKSNAKIILNLDGTIGYGTSWLEEVFGGIARKYGKDRVLKTIELISNEEPYLIDDIKQYIKDA
jgi:hypothetical protein